MTEVMTNVINAATAHSALQQLLDDYQKEKAESQADQDTRFTEYWECACRTIYEIAELLHLPIEDPWVDPYWERTVEYETMLHNMKAKKRRRTRLRTGLDQRQKEQL